MDAAGTLSQLGFSYSLFADSALGCLHLPADFYPHFAHELLIHDKFNAFLAAAYSFSHAIGVNPSNLHYLLWLCCCLLFLRVTLALLIVTMGHIPLATFVL